MSEDKRAIQDFIAKSFNGYQLAVDEKLFELGFVNSLFAMELVEFVESRFQIQVEPEDLEIENFATIDGMIRLVERKRRGVAAA